MSRSVRPDLRVLVEELNGVRKEWYSIGIQLKVPDSELDDIEKTDKDDLKRALRRMIQEWLKQEPEPTWGGIVEALRSVSVNEQRLANNLERRFCTPSAASSTTPPDTTDSTAVAAWSANAASGSEQVLDPELRREMEDMRQAFERLRMKVYRYLRDQPLDLKEFCVFVSSPPPAWKVKRQRPLTEVDLERIMKDDIKFHQIFIVLSQYIDWYNYELLKSIVEEYGNPPIKKQMEDYCTRMDEFEKRTSLDEVKNIQFCQPQQDSIALFVRMPNHQCNQFHLNEIRIVQHALADEAGIDRAAIRTHMVVPSSVTIIFLVPLALAPYLVVSSIPLFSSQEPLPENVYERCAHVIETEEAFRLMGRPFTSLTPALPAAPPLHRSSVSISSSFSSEPRLKPLSVLSPQPTLDPGRVQVFHDKRLDAGASTVVCEARLNHLPCVAKYVHQKLDESYDWPLEKFLEGCKFLESCHHPNIVTFLGMHYDDSLKVTVLLMEKMEQSLHNYLEQAARPVPIHTQLDICHDTAQGLEYIHSREYIHGDLTATNILLQGRRAKIGGMMTLQCKSPDAELSLCPGTPAYMPMRSFSFPDYDESIDCFSFGVLAIQIATGEVPSPTSHTTEPSGEMERYSRNITKVATGHPMYPIILQCLRDESSKRPSAANLCLELSALKEASAYETSLLSETLHVRLLNLQNRFLQQKLNEKRGEINTMKRQHQARLEEVREAVRQKASEDAEKEIESVRSQTKAEKELMKANYQKEKEQLNSLAEQELQRAKKEKTQLEKDLKDEIHRITSACKGVEKEREELKTKTEKTEKEKQDMQERSDDLLSKLRQLETDKHQLESDKQELRGKLEAADRSYAHLLQQAPTH